MDASIQLLGSVVCSIWFMNSVVSFMYEGKLLTYGCSHWFTNWDIFSFMLSQLDTIGRIPIGVLCIFLRKYSLGILWFCGGLQYWYQFFSRNPFLYRLSSFVLIISFNLLVIFSWSFLYVCGSFRCFMASVM